MNAFIFHGTEGKPGDHWFPWLKAKLETKGFQVFVPQFPSPPVVAAKVSEWFEVLESYQDKITEDSVLIGHSLGGVFALRVLEKLEHPVKAAFLVGAPVGVRPLRNYDRDSSFSGFEFDWKKIKTNAKEFVVFQSDDDPFVSLGNGQKLAKGLGVKLNFIANAGHFNAKAGYLKFEKLRDNILELSETLPK